MLQSPIHGETEEQTTGDRAKKTPSPIERSTSGQEFLQEYSTFSKRSGMDTNGPGGGSRMPGGGPGGPPGGGGGDPGDGYSGGRVPQFGDFGLVAKPQSIGALCLEALPRYQGGAWPSVRMRIGEI